MDGNGVVPAQPVNILLEEIKHSVPPCTTFTHGAKMERLWLSGDFTSHRNPVAMQDGCFRLVHHLTSNSDVDVFGAHLFVVVGAEVLLQPRLAWAFEPGLKATWRPHLTLEGHVEHAKTL